MPPTRNAVPAPIVIPMLYTPNALPSLESGKLSVMMEYAAGDRAASPTPTPTRAMKSWLAVRANPHEVAIIDQINTPAAMIARRLCRSDKRAIGKPRKVYSNANASPCNIPICVSLICRSRFIGSTSNEIVVRSMKEKTYISISTATLYHAAKDDGYDDESLLAPLAVLNCAAM